MNRTGHETPAPTRTRVTWSGRPVYRPLLRSPLMQSRPCATRSLRERAETRAAWLTPRQKAAIRRHYDEGTEPEQIARGLWLPVEMIRAALRENGS